MKNNDKNKFIKIAMGFGAAAMVSPYIYLIFNIQNNIEEAKQKQQDHQKTSATQPSQSPDQIITSGNVELKGLDWSVPISLPPLRDENIALIDQFCKPASGNKEAKACLESIFTTAISTGQVLWESAHKDPYYRVWDGLEGGKKNYSGYRDPKFTNAIWEDQCLGRQTPDYGTRDEPSRYLRQAAWCVSSMIGIAQDEEIQFDKTKIKWLQTKISAVSRWEPR